ncbi:coiled-coil domain-containing protein 65-like [Fopius arisanus]|uniref:Dynein regulatory complex subunit 2 n=1 Tax=Fopius arisanus TaxID=64838 RepID=A0A9R1U401_9HYME|nr:PREDICTED: coiled-coil domain-containing protein 65-like [Fopius arisanus]
MEPVGDQSKKKSKGKKLAAIEERKAFLRHEALKRERKIANRNNESLRRSWIKIMAEIKIPIMKEDVEVSRNIFDRTLDIQNYRGHSLLEGLTEAEAQYKRNISGHMTVINRLEDLYNERSTTGYNNYKQYVDEILEESETDVERILWINDESEGFLQSLINREGKMTDELLEGLQSETAYKLDNLREDGNHSTKMALIDIENSIRYYWNAVDSLVTNYSNDTNERRVSYECLKAKDAKDREKITEQLTETGELYETIRKYQEKIKKLEDSSKDTAVHINVERKMSRDAYASMKERFMNEQTGDKIQMMHLTKEYNTTTESLKNLTKKAQSVLAYVRMCRKFEDRALPVQRDPVTGFEYFWRRVGEVEIEVRGLRDDRKILNEEKEHLKSLVKKRIQGTQLDPNELVNWC